jgi:transposase
MAGQKGMKQNRYSPEMVSEIKGMVKQGKTQKEIAEHFGLKDRFVIHQILKRDRKKEKEILIVPYRKGRPRKNAPESLQALLKENKQLRMENELMRSFLQELERK